MLLPGESLRHDSCLLLLQLDALLLRGEGRHDGHLLLLLLEVGPPLLLLHLLVQHLLPVLPSSCQGTALLLLIRVRYRHAIALPLLLSPCEGTALLLVAVHHGGLNGTPLLLRMQAVG